MRAPKLSRKKIEQLAEQFSSRMPERDLSMANLQGYLVSYKSRPFRAVDDIERWARRRKKRRTGEPWRELQLPGMTVERRWPKQVKRTLVYFQIIATFL